jgi:membrane-associated phospholipid phosphatase
MNRFGTRMRCARAAMLATLLATTVGAAPARAQNADSLKASRETLFVNKDVWYAAGFVLGALALAPVDLTIAEELQDSTRQANRFLRDSATGFRVLGRPGSLFLASGMYAAGRLSGHEGLADVGLHTAESLALAIVTTDVLKSIAGRARPEQDPDDPYDFQVGRGFGDHQYSSFPSGHTTAAFAAAAALSTEIVRLHPKGRGWVKPMLYGAAGLVGASRMYNNKHWASDVVGGAAIGVFSGWKVTRYNHTHPGNRLDRWLLSASPRPNALGGVTFSVAF